MGKHTETELKAFIEEWPETLEKKQRSIFAFTELSEH